MTRLLVLPALIILSLCTSRPASADTIHLRDGSSLKGTVLSQDSTSVSINTALGNVVVGRTEIVSIEFGNVRGQSPIDELGGSRELRLARLEDRQRFDLSWLLATYALTLCGDVLMGGTFYPGSAIPVMGPFVNAFTLNDDDYGSNEGAKTRDRVLFLASGVVQTFLAYDWYRAREEKKNLDGPRAALSIGPGQVMLSLKF